MHLTPKQKTVVRKIQELHRKRAPLNISAVKRSSPRLLKTAFAIRPFWGWKRAIESAGLSCDVINVELEEYVTCRICAHDAVNLERHLRGVHELTCADYSSEYPGARTFCERWLANRTAKVGNRLFPHWEPIWSPEYVLDRIAECSRRNIPLYSKWINDHESSLISKATKYFGSWDNALRQAGFDPMQIRAVLPYLFQTPEDVIRALRERKQKGLPLNSSSLYSHENRQNLRDAIVRHFGTIRKALEAAGIDPNEAPTRQSYNEKKIKTMLEAIRKAAALPDEKRRIVWRKLRARYRLILKTERFGNWTKVFTAAGVPGEKFIPSRRYPNRQSVLDALRKRVKQRLPMGANQILLEDPILYQNVHKHFGKFGPLYPLLGIQRPKRRRKSVTS